MCGIAGIISTSTNVVTIHHLKKMTDAIAHRGPDGEGHWCSENKKVFLGHRRLSIIDLSIKAAQPFHYLNRYTIIFNGEIYNYIELKDQLKSKGYNFNSNSDTEVILAAYDFWKEDCVLHFDGMFSFSIWDNVEEKLFVARDYFGEKPFYYYQDEEYLLFASEMKSLWAIGVAKEIDEKMLLNYLTIGQVQNVNDKEQTFYKNIWSLPPAHFFIYKPTERKIVIKKYWQLDKELKTNITVDQAIEKLNHLFTSSINKRLRSDVQVGTSLSGGLDSSSIISTIKNLNANRDVTTFSAIFPGFINNESEYINLVCDKHQIQNFTIEPTVDGLINDFEKLCYHQEEPFISSSIYAQFKVFELAKNKNVKVLLDGQGADEILAGYHKYIHWFLQEKIKWLNPNSIKNEIAALKNNNVAFSWGLKNYFAKFLPIHAAMLLEKKEYNKIGQHKYIHPDFINFQAGKEWQGINKPVINTLNDILLFNTTILGLEELLRYADRNSMANGREVRMPFLDRRLVEFVFSLPANLKIKDGYCKWILRKTMNTKLPNKIVWRKDKIGFETPQQSWMQNKKLQDYIFEAKKLLVNKNILSANILLNKVQPKAANDINNFDWRYLCAAQMFTINTDKF